jgi:hypothetical protein
MTKGGIVRKLGVTSLKIMGRYDYRVVGCGGGGGEPLSRLLRYLLHLNGVIH